MKNNLQIVSTFLLFAATIALLMNIIACYRVVKSETYEPRQKAFQCILVWLFPFLGAGLVLALMREPKKRSKFGYSKQGLIYIDSDFGVSSGSGEHFHDHGGQHDASGH